MVVGEHANTSDSDKTKADAIKCFDHWVIARRHYVTCLATVQAPGATSILLAPVE